jgi:pimeloyl-ACP methyl ester carboxylesterase
MSNNGQYERMNQLTQSASNIPIGEHNINVDGMNIHYRAGGEGPPLVLLHGIGESAFSWSWVLPDLARAYHVYAPDLPGFGDSDKPNVDYSPDFFMRFVAAFLDTLGIERAVLVGNSFGGTMAIRLALSAPSRVTALCLVGSAGLGQAVHPSMSSLTLLGYGELAIMAGKTPLGATQRAWSRAMLLLANPQLARPEWIAEQVRLSQMPGFLEAVIRSLRAQLDIVGQREVLLDQLPRLTMPTLLIWGTHDWIFPATQAQEAVGRLQYGHLVLLSNCGHLSQIECPDRFVAALHQFLMEQVLSHDGG